MQKEARTRTSLWLAAAAFALAALGALALATRRVEAQPSPTQKAVERGAYLVRIGSCNDCHTPFKMGPKGPEPDMARMLSGHPQDLRLPDPPKPVGPWIWSGTATDTAFAGPWGISYTANLTPDEETGLGRWTEDQFIRAMRTGKHQGGGRDILPPMPWNWIGQMTDTDLKALFAYLKSIPPVKNQVPEPVMAPPPPAAAAKK